MESLAALYHITSENLALRRTFIGLDAEVVALLADLRPWADEVADAIAADVTDHHFRVPGTADFFRGYAVERGIGFEALRAEWHEARAGHWRRIFAESGQPEPFGIEYFATLLEAGAGYNRINLPMKWYLGRYPAYLDAVRRQLRENPPQIAGEQGRRRGLRRRGGRRPRSRRPRRGRARDRHRLQLRPSGDHGRVLLRHVRDDGRRSHAVCAAGVVTDLSDRDVRAQVDRARVAPPVRRLLARACTTCSPRCAATSIRPPTR